MLLAMCLSSTGYCSESINDISPKEAIDLAILYYSMNTLEEETILINRCVVTPLYDESGETTYYAIDFFFDAKEKGYVVIAENLNYVQCTEYALEASSSYYTNKDEYDVMYFSPFEVYRVNDEGCYDIAGKRTSEDDIDGNIIDGELIQNRYMLSVAISDDPWSNDALYSSDDPLEFVGALELHPINHLNNVGYTGLYTERYATIETAMNNAGAFNMMYDLSSVNADDDPYDGGGKRYISWDALVTYGTPSTEQISPQYIQTIMYAFCPYSI